MGRPEKVGEKKEGGFSVSATATERESIKLRARELGFQSVGKYVLALHEVEQRLALVTETNFIGERWFMLRDSETAKNAARSEVPQDVTIEEVIHQKFEDRYPHRAKVVALKPPSVASDKMAAAAQAASLSVAALKRERKDKKRESPQPAQ